MFNTKHFLFSRYTFIKHKICFATEMYVKYALKIETYKCLNSAKNKQLVCVLYTMYKIYANKNTLFTYYRQQVYKKKSKTFSTQYKYKKKERYKIKIQFVFLIIVLYTVYTRVYNRREEKLKIIFIKSIKNYIFIY